MLDSAPVKLTRKFAENPAVTVIETVWPYVQSLLVIENAGRGRPERMYGGTNLNRLSYTTFLICFLGHYNLHFNSKLFGVGIIDVLRIGT